MSRLLPLGLLLLLTLSACGKRGPLEPPPGTNPPAERSAAGTGTQDNKARGSMAQAGAEEENPAETNDRTRLGGKKRVPITAPKRELLIDSILE